MLDTGIKLHKVEAELDSSPIWKMFFSSCFDTGFGGGGGGNANHQIPNLTLLEFSK